MLGKIFIKNLTVKAKVGHLIHERHVPQDILVNIAVWGNVSTSIKSENLADTIDYCVIQNAVLNLGTTEEFVLIETFANAILDICFEDARVEKAWIRLEKPHKLPESESVGIEMERER